jgi:hypothetical protein
MYYSFSIKQTVHGGMSRISGWWAVPTLRQAKALSDLRGLTSAYFSDIRAGRPLGPSLEKLATTRDANAL